MRPRAEHLGVLPGSRPNATQRSRSNSREDGMANRRREVVGGVDTHKDVHVAAAIDGQGRILGSESFAASARGYHSLLQWLRRQGTVMAVGVEGTGAWGAGLTRHLTAEGLRVAEVN